MASDERTPITIQDAVVHRAPRDVAISPDGRRVVFALGWSSKEGEHPVADLWLAAADGSSLRRLTSGDSLDHQPRWSPDGRAIAFISDRAKRGTGALYLIAPDGGEAVRLSEWDAAVSAPEWSPDGSRIAVKATDPQSAEEKQRKEERDDVIVHRQDEKLDRLCVVAVPPDPFGASVTPATPERLLAGDWHVWEHAWSPAGGTLAFTAARHTGWGESFHGLRLGVVDAAGGDPRWVNEDGRAPFRTPNSLAWSPDGRRLACIGAFDPKRDAGESIYLVDAADPSQVSERLRDEDATTLGVAWTSAGLVALRLTGLTAALWSLAEDGGAPRLLSAGEQGERGTLALDTNGTPLRAMLDRAGTRWAGVWSDASHPSEVVAGDATGTRVLTAFNAELAGRTLGRTEVLRWQAEDGLEIEGQLIYPVGYEAGTRYPTILHIHGGPSWAWDDHLYADWHDWGQLLAANGYLVLLPNPRGSTGRGTSYQIANHADWMGADYRDSQAGLDLLIERGLADPERLGVGGWSYGGLTTAWTITQTSRFKAAIVGAGVTNQASMLGTTDITDWKASWWRAEFAEDPDAYWQRSAIRYVGQVTTPTLVVHGGNDERVPVSQGWELYNQLRLTGVETQMVVYPREPHGLEERHHQRDLLERVLAWFGKYL